jgi:hypothetical protein
MSTVNCALLIVHLLIVHQVHYLGCSHFLPIANLRVITGRNGVNVPP